ncbi:MAG: hypothetical protein AB1510_05575 [Bacillota bacterium]
MHRFDKKVREALEHPETAGAKIREAVYEMLREIGIPVEKEEEEDIFPFPTE